MTQLCVSCPHKHARPPVHAGKREVFFEANGVPRMVEVVVSVMVEVP